MLNSDAGVSMESGSTEPRPHLVFHLGTEAYAVDVASVREIIEFQGLTEVPLMPAHLRGVIHLRGAVVPVVDLSARFGRPPTEVTRRTSVVILERQHPKLGAQGVGVLVSGVSEVIDLGAEKIEPPPVFGSAMGKRLISGIVRSAGKLYVVLNLSEVLSFEELEAMQALAA